jgi:hypothetical protein
LTNDKSRSEVDAVIEVRHELKSLFGKSKEQIRKVGNAFKRSGFKALNEEITEGLISSRSIELHCPSEWKRKTKPKSERATNAEQKNEKSSFSKEKIPQQQIAATNNGRSVTISEPSPEHEADTRNRPYQAPEGRGQAEHDDILQDTQAVNNKQTAENETENLSNQVQEESKEIAEQQIIEFDFSIPFEDLRSVMQELFKMTKGFGKVLFHGTLNRISGKVTVILHKDNQGESFGCEGKGTILKSNASGFDIIQ